MNTKYLLLYSTSDAQDCPIFNVRVGSSQREQNALLELLAEALLDDDLFLYRVDEKSQEFALRHMEQNPNSEIYECSAAALLKLRKCANSAHVKNLSSQFRTRSGRSAIATHQKLKSWKIEKI